MKKNDKNYRIKYLLTNKKGMALLTTLIFIFILVTFGVALLSMTSNDIKLSALQRDSTKAFYIAEAGVERTLYNLKEDYKSSKDWDNQYDLANPGYRKINGYSLEDIATNGFRKIEYDTDSTVYDVTFGDDTYGDGTYTVALKINSSNYVTIKSKGVYNNKSTRYVQIDVKMGELSVWDNAIFAGSGASGKVINGNVDIRGSVHILGEEGGEAIDIIGVEIGGTGGIGNNYDGMDSDLRSRIKDPPTTNFNEEIIETLNAKLRVMHGDVNLSGAATVGDLDIFGNSYKETLDGVYINGNFGGNKGVDNVHSDDGIDPHKPYDFSEGTFEFPNLEEEYISPETGDPYINYDAYLTIEAHNISDLTDSDGSLLGLDISSIDSTTDSFEGFVDGEEIISWDKDAGTLYISGVIVIDEDFSIGDKLNSIVYNGKGTIVSKDNISIYGDLLADGEKTFPKTNALGLVAYLNLNLETVSQLKVMGAIFAQNSITSAKQNEIAGTFVSDYFDMGGQVPSIYQVPGLEDNLPPGMPGAVVTYTMHTSNWHEVHE